MEACTLDEVFVVSGRSEEVVADGAAGGDLPVRDGASDDKSVAEEKTGGWFQDTECFRQECGPRGDVAEDIVCEGGIEGRVGKRQRL